MGLTLLYSILSSLTCRLSALQSGGWEVVFLGDSLIEALRGTSRGWVRQELSSNCLGCWVKQCTQRWPCIAAAGRLPE